MDNVLQRLRTMRDDIRISQQQNTEMNTRNNKLRKEIRILHALTNILQHYIDNKHNTNQLHKINSTKETIMNDTDRKIIIETAKRDAETKKLTMETEKRTEVNNQTPQQQQNKIEDIELPMSRFSEDHSNEHPNRFLQEFNALTYKQIVNEQKNIIVKNSMPDQAAKWFAMVKDVTPDLEAVWELFLKYFFLERRQREIFMKSIGADKKPIGNNFQEHFHHWMAVLERLKSRTINKEQTGDLSRSHSSTEEQAYEQTTQPDSFLKVWEKLNESANKNRETTPDGPERKDRYPNRDMGDAPPYSQNILQKRKDHDDNHRFRNEIGVGKITMDNDKIYEEEEEEGRWEKRTLEDNGGGLLAAIDTPQGSTGKIETVQASFSVGEDRDGKDLSRRRRSIDAPSKDLTEFHSFDEMDDNAEVLPFVNITVNNEEFEMLVDTGGDHSAISLRYFKQIMEKDSKIPRIPIGGATLQLAVGGNQASVNLEQVLVPIDIGKHYIIHHPFLKIGGLVKGGIIGSDFLKAHNATLNFKDKTLKFPMGQLTFTLPVKLKHVILSELGATEPEDETNTEIPTVDRLKSVWNKWFRHE